MKKTAQKFYRAPLKAYFHLAMSIYVRKKGKKNKKKLYIFTS